MPVRDSQTLTKELQKQLKEIEKQKKQLAKLIQQASASKQARTDSSSSSAEDDNDIESKDSDSQGPPKFRSLGDIQARPVVLPAAKKWLIRLGDPISQSAELADVDLTGEELHAGQHRTTSTPPAPSHHSSREPSLSRTLPLPSSHQSSTLFRLSLVSHGLLSSPFELLSNEGDTRPNQGPASTPSEESNASHHDHSISAAHADGGKVTSCPQPRSPPVPDNGDPARKRPRRSRLPVQRPLQVDVIANKGGKVPQGSKPRQSDYEKWLRNMISKAINLYNLKLTTVHAFPTPEQQRIWAREAWSSICDEHKKCFPEDGSFRIMTLIMNQSSTFCGHLKDKLRMRMLDAFKIPEAADNEAANHSHALYWRLVEGSPPRYCHKTWDTDSPTGYGEHNMFTLALREQLFRNAQDAGAIHQDKLNPIPLPTLALLFTMIRFHLDCYENGQRDDSVVFSEVDYYDHYRDHLSWAKHWSAVDPDETRKMRSDMFRVVLKLSKVPPTSITVAYFSQDAEDRLRTELAARRRAREQVQLDQGQGDVTEVVEAQG
ncbi:uncharacterized protein PHACADRAFT_28007 [Phanerochaete carnosa HHB-10118-sp]|uniref:DUF6532 domain-containing protein n=1 Tax=Phanerochaete carnosa (strain HHB-10118-sp) TaxID=650164 RepID=K5W0L3_PHACS|nr:uncharacterized protein PHACADRAFT_28007 [Phanerochaete carnosa HHB-10118-sp]EKM57348.1 hypothetical protein PHACADRAFT_28007 [Phanerochaete carnosa HHB-10118-sp]